MSSARIALATAGLPGDGWQVDAVEREDIDTLAEDQRLSDRRERDNRRERDKPPSTRRPPPTPQHDQARQAQGAKLGKPSTTRRAGKEAEIYGYVPPRPTSVGVDLAVQPYRRAQVFIHLARCSPRGCSLSGHSLQSPLGRFAAGTRVSASATNDQLTAGLECFDIWRAAREVIDHPLALRLIHTIWSYAPDRPRAADIALQTGIRRQDVFTLATRAVDAVCEWLNGEEFPTESREERLERAITQSLRVADQK